MHGIVPIQTPEEREYLRYLAEIESRQGRVAGLQAEVATLNLTLGRFNAEYQSRVGALFVELDRARLAIAEYERRIASLQQGEDDPAQVERDVAAEFADQRADVEANAEETRQGQRDFARDRDTPPLDATTANHLKELYRNLAKRYHPDLARTDDERRWREVIMRRVNAAFGRRDVAALQGVAQEADADDPAFESRSVGEKLVWAIREVARLDDLIIGLEGELVAIRASDAYHLWHRQESGENVIEALETDISTQLAKARDQLRTLIATYHLVLNGQMP